MKITNLIDEKNWVVVNGDQVLHFETFKESLGHYGHRMTLRYYDLHYREERGL
jgi:hypothetical protein